MPNTNTVDRQAETVRLLVVILGVIVCIAGWYVWAS
jgi:hypothetical protein